MMLDTSLKMRDCEHEDEAHRTCNPQYLVSWMADSSQNFKDGNIEGITALRSNQEKDCFIAIVQISLCEESFCFRFNDFSCAVSS